MLKINSHEEVLQKIKNGVSLVYVHTKDCGVCVADRPRVEELSLRYNFPAYEIDPIEMPILRGQWSLFTAPVVLLFRDGKEMHRQARIIDFRELEHRIVQLKQAL